MPSELLERLNGRYDERPAREVMRGQRSFRGEASADAWTVSTTSSYT